MVNPVQCDNKALPITLDLNVSVTKAQVLATVDLSVAVFVSSTGDLSPGAGRIRYYNTLTELEIDWGTTSEAYKAGRDFFAQSPRAQTLAVGQAFSTPQPGTMTTAQTGTLADFVAISDGEFVIAIDGVSNTILGLDFSTDTSLGDVAGTLQAGIQSVAAGGFTAATVVASNAAENQFTFTSGTSGDGSTVSVTSSPVVPVGTDVSGVGFINGQSGTTIAGYTPTTFANELTLIQEAASCSGKFVYGWCLDAFYRDAQEQLDAAAWAEPQQFVDMAIVSNNPLSYDASNTTNNVYSVFNNGYTKTYSFFHDNAEYYPDAASLATLLSVDYNGLNTALTMKFKNLIGIPTVGLSVTQLNVLESRRCNTFVTIGNGARTVRQGVQASTAWFADDRTNIDNFVNDLLTSVYNVFITNPKVPFTTAGQGLLYKAEQTICQQYVNNGTFADKVSNDPASPSGVSTISAYVIVFQPLQDVTQADRDARVMSGNSITLQLAGAVHTLQINIIVED